MRNDRNNRGRYDQRYDDQGRYDRRYDDRDRYDRRVGQGRKPRRGRNVLLLVLLVLALIAGIEIAVYLFLKQSPEGVNND